MTYYELLEEAAEKKAKAIKELNAAMNGPTGWLVKAEIERDPGAVAWLYLAKWFCETLEEHLEEFFEQAGDVDSPEVIEFGSIYMKYYDGDPDLYEYLPFEARLFDE